MVSKGGMMRVGIMGILGSLGMMDGGWQGA